MWTRVKCEQTVLCNSLEWTDWGTNPVQVELCDACGTVGCGSVREARLRQREVFVPLMHPPGDAQADFGEALVAIGGVEQKAHFLCVDLPHSDDSFVMAFPAETTEAFLEGHRQAFEYFGGVPRTILYDNTRIAVADIAGDGERRPTEAFSALQSHYLFAAKFGRPGRGNDKGNVEGLVGYARRNFLVPVPRSASWEELNRKLAEDCGRRRDERIRGEKETIGERFERDREKLLPLAATPHEACARRSTRASSQALVRFETNDYSVPVAYAHHPVLVKAFVWEVVISASSEVIARHARSYGREEMIFDPLHYLALLEQKTNALDQAAPLQGWAGGAAPTSDQLRAMLRTMLADRFQLKIHRETRDLPVYNLVVAKGGLKVKRATADEPPAKKGSASTAARSFESLAQERAIPSEINGIMQLIALFLDHPVLNKTNLSGKYEFEWDVRDLMEEARLGKPAPSIFPIVRGFGLNLELTKAPTEIIVVDHAAKPSEN